MSPYPHTWKPAHISNRIMVCCYKHMNQLGTSEDQCVFTRLLHEEVSMHTNTIYVLCKMLAPAVDCSACLVVRQGIPAHLECCRKGQAVPISPNILSVRSGQPASVAGHRCRGQRYTLPPRLFLPLRKWADSKCLRPAHCLHVGTPSPHFISLKYLSTIEYSYDLGYVLVNVHAS